MMPISSHTLPGLHHWICAEDLALVRRMHGQMKHPSQKQLPLSAHTPLDSDAYP